MDPMAQPPLMGGQHAPHDELGLGQYKHQIHDAEAEQQAAENHLADAERVLRAAAEARDAAKKAYDATATKVARVKARFKDQIMDENLRQTCRWNDMYYKLIEWKETHDGDTIVPVNAQSSEETKRLNRWVINQRSAYKYFMNGDRKHIKDHRIDALNRIGFVWSVNDQLWDQNYEALKRYHDETGSFDVAVKQNRKLANFVTKLRTAWGHREEGLVQHELSEERIDKLKSIGFTWGAKRKSRKPTAKATVKFDVMYGHLVEFKDCYGHLKTSKKEKEWKAKTSVPEKKEFRRLPQFMSFVRKEKLQFDEGRPSALDAEKVQMLTDLGVGWKKPASEPRKNTGGESSRRKRKREEEQQGGIHYQGYSQDGMLGTAVAAMGSSDAMQNQMV
ncbi:hypothetical protein ACHAXT_012208 [Thalassiosira profunda]